LQCPRQSRWIALRIGVFKGEKLHFHPDDELVSLYCAAERARLEDFERRDGQAKQRREKQGRAVPE